MQVDPDRMKERDLAIEICVSQAVKAFSLSSATVHTAIEKANEAWAKKIAPVRTDQEHPMRFVDAVHERDLLIELFLLNSLSPDSRDRARTTVRESIKKADKAWVEKILPARVGPDMARAITERLNANIVPR
jgi:hypothetical protein